MTELREILADIEGCAEALNTTMLDRSIERLGRLADCEDREIEATLHPTPRYTPVKCSAR